MQFNVEIMPYVFFVPEAKPRDTKHTVGLISIRYFDNRHILNAQSEAVGYKSHHEHNFYLILQQGTHFECLHRSLGYISYK